MGLVLKDVIDRLGFEIKVGGDLSKVVEGCYISDLLSDVMARSNEHELWITLQTHPNIVAVSVIKGLPAIVLPNGRSPEPATAAKAEEEHVIILSSDKTTFEIAGLLYNLLKG
ncbi:MAG: serine kinase [Nitrospirae bacterium]|nr:MAG: serine kinase [Nitrospirota bacterium]